VSQPRIYLDDSDTFAFGGRLSQASIVEVEERLQESEVLQNLEASNPQLGTMTSNLFMQASLVCAERVRERLSSDDAPPYEYS